MFGPDRLAHLAAPAFGRSRYAGSAQGRRSRCRVGSDPLRSKSTPPRREEIALRIDPREASPARPNSSLIKLVARAHLFHSKLIKTSEGKYNQLAKREKLNRAYFTRVLRLAYLAPDITRAILEGRQPPGLTFAKLTQDSYLPLAWPEQRKALGFD